MIASEKQYQEYTNKLEELVFSDRQTPYEKEEIALLTVLIEKWDRENYDRPTADPVQLLKSFMKEHNLRAIDLVAILGISKGTVSEMLNYKKGMSKEVIRKLAVHFKSIPGSI